MPYLMFLNAAKIRRKIQTAKGMAVFFLTSVFHCQKFGGVNKMCYLCRRKKREAVLQRSY